MKHICGGELEVIIDIIGDEVDVVVRCLKCHEEMAEAEFIEKVTK